MASQPGATDSAVHVAQAQSEDCDMAQPPLEPQPADCAMDQALVEAQPEVQDPAISQAPSET